MTRQIRVDQIDDVFRDAIIKLVKNTTLKWTVLTKKATPSVTNNLRGSWQTVIEPYEGNIFNIVEYSEPVVFGTSLPPSWKGRYRTRKNTIKGFPILQAKQLTAQYIPTELSKIIRSFGASQYLTQEAPNSSTTSTNLVVGLCLFNIYTKQGIGAGDNFAICKRLRNLFNRITVSDVRFDAPEGPEILQSSPEGRFQTQISITFEIYESLTP